MPLLKTVAAIAGLAMAGAAAASVDTSPKPGGVYKLKPGIYVQKGVSCGTAPNSAIRQYDGRGISDAHSRSCRARILSRRGEAYEVSQSCIDAGAGPAPRVVQRQVVTVPDALTFTMRTGRGASAYRYCPAYMLPAGMPGAAR
ncbi:hypothetical protein [Sphingomonas sp. R86521]|uniref:hypothetical protein n=1 Tax=Sphingomonas sp. R86521 TaxID=3093860 RepID=UPI0036D2C7AE